LFITLKNVVELGAFTEEVIPRPLDPEDLEKEIKIQTEQLKQIKLYYSANKEKVLIGLLMNKLRGRIPAKVVAKKIGLMKGVSHD
jgi:hypothetical protein